MSAIRIFTRDPEAEAVQSVEMETFTSRKSILQRGETKISADAKKQDPSLAGWQIENKNSLGDQSTTYQLIRNPGLLPHHVTGRKQTNSLCPCDP